MFLFMGDFPIKCLLAIENGSQKLVTFRNETSIQLAALSANDVGLPRGETIQQDLRGMNRGINPVSREIHEIPW